MSWLALLKALGDEESRMEALIREEGSNRSALIVEERSCVAHIGRKLRDCLRGKYSNSSDDDDLDAAQTKPAASSSLLLKFKIVAERRQLEWDLYEVKVRDLRRLYEETRDPKLIDQLNALPVPAKKKQHQTVGATVAAAAAAPPHARPSSAKAACEATQPRPSSALKTLLPPLEPPPQLPPFVQQILKEEGLARASMVMEERSNRTALSNKLKISLIEGDEDLRIMSWDKQWHLRELEARLGERAAQEHLERERQFEELANRHRAVVAAQTSRVLYRKMLRERRVEIQTEETISRGWIVEEWQKWFELDVVIMNFGTLLRLVPEEEMQHRAKLMGDETRDFRKFVLRSRKYFQDTETLQTTAEFAFGELFDTESFYIRRHIELYHKQVEEEERDMKRREMLRKAEEAMEIERLKLEAKYGASPLTLRPGSGTGTNRIVLRPIDRLEIIIASHPPENITESVRRTMKMNQENNSLYMALDKRYVKVGAAADAQRKVEHEAAQQELARLQSEEAQLEALVGMVGERSSTRHRIGETCVPASPASAEARDYRTSPVVALPRTGSLLIHRGGSDSRLDELPEKSAAMVVTIRAPLDDEHVPTRRSPVSRCAPSFDDERNSMALKNVVPPPSIVPLPSDAL